MPTLCLSIRPHPVSLAGSLAVFATTQDLLFPYFTWLATMLLLAALPLLVLAYFCSGRFSRSFVWACILLLCLCAALIARDAFDLYMLRQRYAEVRQIGTRELLVQVWAGRGPYFLATGSIFLGASTLVSACLGALLWISAERGEKGC